MSAGNVPDRITVIVVPDERSPVRRFQVPRALLRHGVWIAALIAMLLSAAVVDYVRLRIEAVEVEQLRAEASRHRETILALSEDVEGVEQQLRRIREFERKVRVIADLPAAIPEVAVPDGMATNEAQGLPLGPAGGENGPWEQRTSSAALEAGADPLDAAYVDGLNHRARTLFLRTEVQRDVFEALIEQLDGKRHRLASTPSIWPTDGWVTSRYGYRTSPFTGKRKFHGGLDIAADPGTPVVAPARGKVVMVGRKGPLGKTVILDHGYGFRTTYGHNSEVLVKLGQEVERGETIAKVGSTGRSTGPHLHYAVNVNEKSVNPADYIIR